MSMQDTRRARSARSLAAAVALSVLTVACGGGGTGDSAQTGTGAQISPQEGVSSNVAALSPRPLDGVAAAGGASLPGPSCDADAAAEALTIAWVGPELEEAGPVGLGALDFDNPSLIVEAYINALNHQGGSNGRCLELSKYSWDPLDPSADTTSICRAMPQEEPVLLLALMLDEATLRCATKDAGIPTVGLWTSLPDSVLKSAGDRLFLDQGSTAHLAAVGMSGALQFGSVSSADTLGLLYEEGTDGLSAVLAVRKETKRLGLKISAESSVPSRFSDLGVLLGERQVGLLRSDLSEEEAAAAEEMMAMLPTAVSETLLDIEIAFTVTANWFQTSGVTAVVATVGWSDVRRLMRAAEAIGWFPTWLLNDSQPASLVLTETPNRQGANVLQVSHNRAAGDDIPQMDRGCVSLRNTSVEARPFTPRAHTDAWNLMTNTCDYLDAVFGAMARIVGPVTRESLVEALARTNYQTANGSRIVFAPEDRFGNDQFRVLRADPDCVLNEWGCMRAVSDWLAL